MTKAVDKYKLKKKEIDNLDKLDDIIQDKNFEAHMGFISTLIHSDLFDRVFGGREDEYIGMTFHSFSVLAKSKRVDDSIRKRIIEILNRAVTGINGIAVAKQLADDLRNFAAKLDERGVSEATQIWWFADGGLAITDLKPLIQKFAPTSAKLFNWSEEIALIRDGFKSGADLARNPKQTEDEKKPRFLKSGGYQVDAETKQTLFDYLTVEDTYEVEDHASMMEYSYESYEALSDALDYWCGRMRDRREAGDYIFDINEELNAGNRILEAMQDSDKKTQYSVSILRRAIDFLTSPAMKDDGDTADDDESHTVRAEAINRAKALLLALENG